MLFSVDEAGSVEALEERVIAGSGVRKRRDQRSVEGRVREQAVTLVVVGVKVHDHPTTAFVSWADDDGWLVAQKVKCLELAGGEIGGRGAGVRREEDGASGGGDLPAKLKNVLRNRTTRRPTRGALESEAAGQMRS